MRFLKQDHEPISKLQRLRKNTSYAECAASAMLKIAAIPALSQCANIRRKSSETLYKCHRILLGKKYKPRQRTGSTVTTSASGRLLMRVGMNCTPA